MQPLEFPVCKLISHFGHRVAAYDDNTSLANDFLVIMHMSIHVVGASLILKRDFF